LVIASWKTEKIQIFGKSLFAAAASPFQTDPGPKLYNRVEKLKNNSPKPVTPNTIRVTARP